jgi:predicted RNA-binding protein with PIN domain
MGLVRILVDGYSLLHSWEELAPGRQRFSAAARDELIRKLSLYQDVSGTPITVFFDGSNPGLGTENAPEKNGVEVLYSQSGKTADDLIERVACLLVPYGQVLTVTDDGAERQTVISLGGLTSNCRSFVDTVERALTDLQAEIRLHNRKERHRFQKNR